MEAMTPMSAPHPSPLPACGERRLVPGKATPTSPPRPPEPGRRTRERGWFVEVTTPTSALTPHPSPLLACGERGSAPGKATPTSPHPHPNSLAARGRGLVRGSDDTDVGPHPSPLLAGGERGSLQGRRRRRCPTQPSRRTRERGLRSGSDAAAVGRDPQPSPRMQGEGVCCVEVTPPMSPQPANPFPLRGERERISERCVASCRARRGRGASRRDGAPPSPRVRGGGWGEGPTRPR